MWEVAPGRVGDRMARWGQEEAAIQYSPWDDGFEWPTGRRRKVLWCPSPL